MPIVINSLGGRHTHTLTHIQIHIQTSTQEQFKKTDVPATGRSILDLKTALYLSYRTANTQEFYKV